MPASVLGPSGSTGVLSQVSELSVTGVEVAPYAEDFISPYPTAMTSDYSGYELTGVSVNGSETERPSTDQTYAIHDLKWVAGDTASFDFFFDNVCWTWVEPVSHPGVTWEQRQWKAQVRSTTLMYANYWWPPMRPYGPLMLDFVVTATYTADYNGNGPGTMVNLLGAMNRPGSGFVWDLQSLHFLDPMNQDLQDITAYAIRTWISGKVTIQNQVTMLTSSSSGYYPEIQYP